MVDDLGRGVKVFEHRAVGEVDRRLEVRVAGGFGGGVVRLSCDAPGLAAVGHVLSWQEWDELVAAVDAGLEGGTS